MTWLKCLKRHSYLIAVIIFAMLIFLPPIIHGEQLGIINNDTAGHLRYFDKIERGDLDVLYPSQIVVGKVLIWLKDSFGLSIQTSFMYYNYLTLLLSGLLVSLLVKTVTKHIGASIIALFLATFGLGSTMHLFWSGTTFNISEVLIWFPLAFIILYYLRGDYSKRTKALLSIAGIADILILVFWHPSMSIRSVEYFTPAMNYGGVAYSESVINPFDAVIHFLGIANLGIIFICSLSKPNMDSRQRLIGLCLVTVFCGLFVLSSYSFTPFSSRLSINAFLVLGIYLCLLIGYVLNKVGWKTKAAIYGLAALSIIPNLINWFVMTSQYNPERGLY